MSYYVITDVCELDGACVDSCPVDCIQPHLDKLQGETQLYIDPLTCINCGACEPVCHFPGAIYALDDLPDNKQQFIKINADYFDRG